jgi:hypothetical protein
MKQVKFFSGHIAQNFENEINKWLLAEGKEKKILDIKFSNAEDDFGCLIIYEEK